MGVLIAPYPHRYLLLSIFFFFFNHGHPFICKVKLKWYLIVILTCIFLMTNDVEPFVLYLLPFVYRLWRKVYSHPLPSFNWAICLFTTELKGLYAQVLSVICKYFFSHCVDFFLFLAGSCAEP